MPPAELASWLQLAAIVVGIGTVLVRLGGRNEALAQTTNDLKELTAIVRDLVRSQVEGEVRHDAMRDTLDELRKRLDRLEASRWGVGGRDSH
jgi:hypothetical protein